MAFRAGVSIGPGEMALTRTPSGVTSRASDLVKPITPALAAAYAAAGRMEPYSPAVEAKLTIEPDRGASMAGSTARQATSAVSRLAEIISVQSAGDRTDEVHDPERTRHVDQPVDRAQLRVASATKAAKSSKSAASAGPPPDGAGGAASSSLSGPRGLRRHIGDGHLGPGRTRKR